MSTKVFKGANVFMSRNLVPPELFDSLHDALKLNGAQVFLCCDPSRNSPNDYHVISSPDHEKFEDLRSKGCNLLGPQCVVSCAKERRLLPKQGFTCCLAMDGVKLLASGFEPDEKVEIDKLVTAMGGVLLMKTSMDVSFVIVKNVLAAKYKWAANVLKKPIVTMNWLHQCWKEHRVVPQESYRVLPFSGLTICVTRILADERKQMEKVIIENGGKYSGELTKKCTHLICDIFLDYHYAPEGDKYKVAKRWGHIHIITKKWFEQSVVRRVCLNEEAYPAQGSSASTRVVKKVVVDSQDKSIAYAECEPSSGGAASEPHSILYPLKAELDFEVTVLQSMPSIFQSDPVIAKVDCGPPAAQLKNDSNVDGCIADDSQTEDNDLYLSDCRMLLVGFDASDMRKLVSMIRRGGGSRYMSFNEKLTHIIVGTPSGSEIKEVRNHASSGVIFVVKTEWLEECDRGKKEVPVLRRHIAYDLLLPKDPVCSGKRSLMSTNEKKQGKCSAQPSLPENPVVDNINSRSDASLEEGKEAGCIRNSKISLAKLGNPVKLQKSSELDGKGILHQPGYASHVMDHQISSNVFTGKLFCFSASFPADQRAEIVEWVNQGGGEVVDSLVEGNVHFIVESHGVVPSDAIYCMSKYVSSHWIRASLMDGCLLDVSSHILYSPLPCQIPFLGFKSFRFCVSQYDKKERLLLRNMCFILGVQFVEKLTKKVTHLLCKFSGGEKYEAACKWGIQPVTSEWIYECVKQNKVVAPGPFFPKEVTSQDRGACTMTQYSSQAVRMISHENESQFPSQSQSLKTMETVSAAKKNEEPSNSSGSIQTVQMVSGEYPSQIPSQSHSSKTLETASFTRKNEDRINSNCHAKKARIFEADKRSFLCESKPISSVCRVTPMETDRTESADVTTMDTSQSLKHLETESFTRKNEVTPMEDYRTGSDGEGTTMVPEVASIIDLLEQTSKIHDQKSPGRSGCNRTIFPSDCGILGQDHREPQSAPAFPKHWINRFDQIENPPEDVRTGDYDAFTDTQTESQVVSYAQDLSGMQMIIDRVRTRNSMT